MEDDVDYMDGYLGTVLCTIVYVCVCVEYIRVNHEEEVEDDADYMDEELGTVEPHKSVILSLLQQLKLGMDLTKVTLSNNIYDLLSLSTNKIYLHGFRPKFLAICFIFRIAKGKNPSVVV